VPRMLRVEVRVERWLMFESRLILVDAREVE
jgi:hypothetical protein